MILTWLTSKQCILLLIFFICLFPSLSISLWVFSTFPASNEKSTKQLTATTCGEVTKLWVQRTKFGNHLITFPLMFSQVELVFLGCDLTYKPSKPQRVAHWDVGLMLLSYVFTSSVTHLAVSFGHIKEEKVTPRCRSVPLGAPLPVWKAARCHEWNTLPPPLPLVVPNCVLQHLFIIDGRHDGYGHNINVRLTQQRHESWLTLFQSRRFIGPPLKSDI